MSDSGTPFVLTLPESLDIVQTYNDLAKTVSEEVEKKISGEVDHEVDYDPKLGKVIVKFPDGKSKKIDPFEMRIKCLCAACVDEVDGR